MANTVADVISHHHLRKALDVLVVDDLPETDPGGLSLGVHLAVLTLHYSRPDSETWTFKLSGSSQDFKSEIVL